MAEEPLESIVTRWPLAPWPAARVRIPRARVRMKTRIVDSFEGFDRLRGEWEALHPLEAGADLPLTWAWFAAWMEGFLRTVPHARPSIRVFEEDDEVVAIAPLMETVFSYHGLSIPCLSAMANGMSPFWDVVFRADLSEAKRGEVARRLVQQLDRGVLELRALRETSPLRRYLERGDCRSWGHREETVTPLIDCTGTMDEHLRRRSRKYRSRLKRKLRDFNGTEGTRIDRVPIKGGKDPVMDTLIEISRQSWKAAEGRDLWSASKNRAFLTDLLDVLGPLDRAEAVIAYLHSEPIAFELLIYSGSVVYPICADFSEAARQLSPGSVTEHYALGAAFEDDGVETYDTCAANYWYLSRKADRTRTTSHTLVMPRTPGGQLLRLFEFRAKPLLRRWVKRTSEQ